MSNGGNEQSTTRELNNMLAYLHKWSQIICQLRFISNVLLSSVNPPTEDLIAEQAIDLFLFDAYLVACELCVS